MSASKLYQIAGVLGTTPDFFFGGLSAPQLHGEGEAVAPEAWTLQQFLLTGEGPALAILIGSMPEATRSRVMNLLWALTSDEAAL